MSEVILTDPSTGGRKGTKLARFDLIPPGPITRVAEHYGKGAEKYDDRNWERGYAWSLSFAAMQRHAWAWRGGEDIDPETQTPHLAAVVFHALALMEFANTHPEKDDRKPIEQTIGWFVRDLNYIELMNDDPQLPLCATAGPLPVLHQDETLWDVAVLGP